MKLSQLRTKFKEATTLKSQAQRLMRDMTEMLTDKSLPENLRKQIEDVRRELKRTWAELARDAEGPIKSAEVTVILPEGSEDVPLDALLTEVTKTVDGQPHPASDFLVVEDPEQSSTWHLQVKQNGKVDHRLLGAAWAALHQGYRGNKYEGPDKGKAMAKLKALYKSEDMEVPTAESVTEYDDGMMPAIPLPIWGAKTFADLDAAEAAGEAASKINERTYQLQNLIANIMSDPNEADKVGALKTVFDEFTALVGDLTGTGTGAGASMAGAEADDAPQPEGERLAESFGGALMLSEADMPANGNGVREPLNLEVRLITPGWGNLKDNHYYPAEVLRRDAKVFEGAAMYTTDHVVGEKSERTKVSIVNRIKRFADDGAPIADVTIFDPDFAEKTRNRAKADLLDTLKCSILAYGKTKPGMVDGRKGDIVEAITSRGSVDWVSQDGAGGNAERIAENAKGVNHMTTETSAAIAANTPVIVNAPAAVPPPTTIPLPAPAAPPPSAAPVALAEAEVKTALAATTLPAPSQKRLVAQPFKDKAELDAAVASEVAYLKEVIGSGKPLMPKSPSGDKPASLAEVNQRVDSTLDRFFGAPRQAVNVKK